MAKESILIVGISMARAVAACARLNKSFKKAHISIVELEEVVMLNFSAPGGSVADLHELERRLSTMLPEETRRPIKSYDRFIPKTIGRQRRK